MTKLHVQRVGRRIGDHGAVYREIVLTGTQRGQAVRVVLQLPWNDSPRYVVGEAVGITWADGEAVSHEVQLPIPLTNWAPAAVCTAQRAAIIAAENEASSSDHDVPHAWSR